MNPAKQTIKQTDNRAGEACVTITIKATEWVAQEPELVIEQIQMQATEIGPVLEGILRERHDTMGYRLTR